MQGEFENCYDLYDFPEVIEKMRIAIRLKYRYDTQFCQAFCEKNPDIKYSYLRSIISRTDIPKKLMVRLLDFLGFTMEPVFVVSPKETV